jgi:hypothetical protein
MMKEFNLDLSWVPGFNRRLRADVDDFVEVKGSFKIDGSYTHKVIRVLEALEEDGSWKKYPTVVTYTSGAKFYTASFERLTDEEGPYMTVVTTPGNPDFELHSNAEKLELLVVHYD